MFAGTCGAIITFQAEIVRSRSAIGIASGTMLKAAAFE
jgi:hypothetical protein